MPSGEGPLPTKRAMHIKRKPSALPCREAAQFNEGAPANRHPPLVSAERLNCLFLCFACHARRRVPVASLVVRHRSHAMSKKPYLFAFGCFIVGVLIGVGGAYFCGMAYWGKQTADGLALMK